MSKKLPVMSKVMELHKTTFADILNILGQGKSESNHTPKFLTDCRAEGTTRDGIWEICFYLITLSF